MSRGVSDKVMSATYAFVCCSLNGYNSGTIIVVDNNASDKFEMLVTENCYKG